MKTIEANLNKTLQKVQAFRFTNERWMSEIQCL
jgi:hypothetical protein